MLKHIVFVKRRSAAFLEIDIQGAVADHAGSDAAAGPRKVKTIGTGSTTIYFGPTQPKDVKRGNWIQTMPGKGWFTLLRLYSPLESFFTKECG